MQAVESLELRPDLRLSIEAAKALHAFIEASRQGPLCAGSETVSLFAAHYTVVREHYASILRLLGLGDCDSSAFALARPLIEGAYKAHWVVNFAKPAVVSRILHGVQCYPPLAAMAEAVDSNFFTDPLFAPIASYLRMLRTPPGFGADPVNRHFGDLSTRSSFEDRERLQLVHLATLHLAALGIAWYNMALPHSGAPDPQETLLCAHLVNVLNPQMPA